MSPARSVSASSGGGAGAGGRARADRPRAGAQQTAGPRHCNLQSPGSLQMCPQEVRQYMQQILTKLREYSGCNNTKQDKYSDDQRIFMSSSHLVTVLLEEMQLIGKKYFVSVKAVLVQYNACKRKEIRVK